MGVGSHGGVGAGPSGPRPVRTEGFDAPVSQIVVKRPPRALPPELLAEGLALKAPPRFRAGSGKVC